MGNLPPELLEQVAGKLQAPRNLYAMRATSRDMRAAVDTTPRMQAILQARDVLRRHRPRYRCVSVYVEGKNVVPESQPQLTAADVAAELIQAIRDNKRFGVRVYSIDPPPKRAPFVMYRWWFSIPLPELVIEPVTQRSALEFTEAGGGMTIADWGDHTMIRLNSRQPAAAVDRLYVGLVALAASGRVVKPSCKVDAWAKPIQPNLMAMLSNVFQTVGVRG